MKEMYREPEIELVLQLGDVIRTSFDPDADRGEEGGDDVAGPNA